MFSKFLDKLFPGFFNPEECKAMEEEIAISSVKPYDDKAAEEIMAATLEEIFAFAKSEFFDTDHKV